MFLASNHLTILSCTSNSKHSLSSKSSSEINHITKTSNNMPSKKRTTCVRFNDASRTANQQTSSQITTRTASQRSNSPGNTRTSCQQPNSLNNTRAASPLQITTPTSPAHSSNVSTPLTRSPNVPSLDYIVSKIFNKSLMASLASKDSVLKEVWDCILTNNKSRLKALNPYIH